MLKDFNVLQLRHKNGVPLCMGLFCINVQPSPYPYAWLDTIKDPDELTITLVKASREFDREQVAGELANMIDAEATLPNIRDYLISLAEEKLSKRQNYFDTQGRKYRKTHHAAHDVAFACRPSYASKRMEESLKRVREDVSNGFVVEDDGLTLLGYNEKPPKWTWEQYEEPRAIIESLLSRFHGAYIPLPISIWESKTTLNDIAETSRVAHKSKAVIDKRRWRTAKSRMQFLVAQAGHLRNLEQPTSFMQDVPCPLVTMSAEELAQTDSILDILVATEDWICQNYLMNHKDVYLPVNRQKHPKRFSDQAGCIKLAGTHKLQGDMIVLDESFVTSYVQANFYCASLVEEHNISRISPSLRSYMDNHFEDHKRALEVL